MTVVSRRTPAGRLLAARSAAIGAARPTTSEPAPTLTTLAHALASRAAELDEGGAMTPARRAIHNRSEVARMSAARTPVAEIAAALGLSTRQVVELRAQLGVGRRRGQDVGHRVQGPHE